MNYTYNLFGYIGFYFSIRISLKFIFHIVRKSIRKVNFKDYKKEYFDFTFKYNYIQKKKINYVLMNCNSINIVSLFALINKFIFDGFQIILLFERSEKQIIYLNNIPNVIVKSYDKKWDEETFNNKLNKKLRKFNYDINCISIYVHSLNNVQNIIINTVLLNIVIKEMTLNIGKSLILYLHEKTDSTGKFFKELQKTLKQELDNKIDFIKLKQII
jgi:hypothetical protein